MWGRKLPGGGGEQYVVDRKFERKRGFIKAMSICRLGALRFKLFGFKDLAFSGPSFSPDATQSAWECGSRTEHGRHMPDANSTVHCTHIHSGQKCGVCGLVVPCLQPNHFEMRYYQLALQSGRLCKGDDLTVPCRAIQPMDNCPILAANRSAIT